MNLNVEKILIIGLGMIGSSIALASKSKGIEVYGFDKSNNSIKEALEKNIIDTKVESILDINSKDFVKKVDLIIVAVPPKPTLDVLNDLKDIWNTDVTITDTSSVKNHIKLNGASILFFLIQLLALINQEFLQLMEIFSKIKKMFYVILLTVKKVILKKLKIFGKTHYK